MATYTGTRKPSSRRQLVVVGLTALAVGLAAGVGATKVDLHGHRGRTATQVQPQGGSQASSLPATGSTAAEQPQDVAASGDSSAPASSSVHTPASIPYLYLVGSAAQANDVQQRLDQIVIAWQPVDARVLVVPPEVSGGEVAASVDELRQAEGLAPVTVEDLRPAVVPASSPPATAARAIADENQLRASLGLPELPAAQ
jgi:hypothetical protein